LIAPLDACRPRQAYLIADADIPAETSVPPRGQVNLGLSTLPASRLIAATSAALVIIGIAVATAAIPNMTTSGESVIGAHKNVTIEHLVDGTCQHCKEGRSSQITRSLVAKITE
jgi:hypothetical protein